MSDLRYPSRYQINDRVWLTELARALGRAVYIPGPERMHLVDVPFTQAIKSISLGIRFQTTYR